MRHRRHFLRLYAVIGFFLSSSFMAREQGTRISHSSPSVTTTQALANPDLLFSHSFERKHSAEVKNGLPYKKGQPMPSSPFYTSAKAASVVYQKSIIGTPEDLLPGGIPKHFSLVGAETVVAVAILKKWNLLGLAGKVIVEMKNRTVDWRTRESVVQNLQDVLYEKEAEWKLPGQTIQEVLLYAKGEKGNSEFDPQEPEKLVISAVKDLMDRLTFDAVYRLNKKIFSYVGYLTKRKHASSEGEGRDGLADGEAIASGSSWVFTSTLAEGLDAEHVRKIVRRMGLREYYYTLEDVLEGTNPAAGVVETGVAYKEEDLLPPGVQIADLSGATSVSVDAHTDHQDYDALNADDGYAHTVVAFVPADQIKPFAENPVDPDQPEIFFPRLHAAWGDVKPSEVRVIVINRKREIKHIQWLSQRGYQILLIPDGTLVPSVFTAMGELLPGDAMKGIKNTVIWTSAGAPEGMMAVATAKALRSKGAIASARRYSKHISDKEQLNTWGGNFSIWDKKEIDRYHALFPLNWQNVLAGHLLTTHATIEIKVDVAVSFATANKIFQEPSVSETKDSERYRIASLGVNDLDGYAHAWIRYTEGDSDALVNGDAYLAVLHAMYLLEESRDIAYGQRIEQSKRLHSALRTAN